MLLAVDKESDSLYSSQLVHNVSCPVHSAGPYKIPAPLDPDVTLHTLETKYHWNLNFAPSPLREPQSSQRICNLYREPGVIEEVEVGEECCTQGGDDNCVGLRGLVGRHGHRCAASLPGRR